MDKGDYPFKVDYLDYLGGLSSRANGKKKKNGLTHLSESPMAGSLGPSHHSSSPRAARSEMADFSSPRVAQIQLLVLV